MLLEINHKLDQALLELAARQHKTAEQLVNEAVMEFLEDYQDIQAADAAILEIEQGKDGTTSLADWERQLNALDH